MIKSRVENDEKKPLAPAHPLPDKLHVAAAGGTVRPASGASQRRFLTEGRNQMWDFR